MSLLPVISRWHSNEGQPSLAAAEPSASQSPIPGGERRKKSSLRRLYDRLPTDAQTRLRADTEARAEQEVTI